jgi:hypothetical protein
MNRGVYDYDANEIYDSEMTLPTQEVSKWRQPTVDFSEKLA